MDKERRKKIQTTKLVITEIFMLVIIVLTVVTLTFIVMGYHLNEEGKLEQSGLVQIESMPTGASVTIDDEPLHVETNTSKILPEGSHTIKLEKPGYTSWSKTVELHSGFLTKLSYPRLYKEDYKTETIQDFKTSPSLLLASKDYTKGLIKYPDGKLEIFDLVAKNPSKNQLELSKIIENSTHDELSSAEILSWSKSGERIILSLEKGKRFFVIDLEHPEYSLDLSAEFDLEISDLSFLNDQGDRLGVLEGNHFRTISLTDQKLSDILIDNVLSFENYHSKILLITKKPSENKKIILYDVSDKSKVFLADSLADCTRAFISEYAGRFTLVFISDHTVTVRRGDLPTEDITKENPLNEPVGKYALDFGTPKDFSFKGGNQLIVTSSDNNFAVFDLENYKLSSYTIDTPASWADEYTISTVADGKLVFYDFDGTNRIVLGAAENGSPAIISKNNNYLYYLNTVDSKLSLVRGLIK